MPGYIAGTRRPQLQWLGCEGARAGFGGLVPEAATLNTATPLRTKLAQFRQASSPNRALQQ